MEVREGMSGTALHCSLTPDTLDMGKDTPPNRATLDSALGNGSVEAGGGGGARRLPRSSEGGATCVAMKSTTLDTVVITAPLLV